MSAVAPAKVADAIRAWLGRVTAVERPSDGIVAFNVGLFETRDGYTAYLVGAKRYDPGNSDWACEEAFTPRERYLVLPIAGAEKPWSAVLDVVADAVRGFVKSAQGAGSFLASAQAVTVGFDDGDLVRVR